MRRDEFNMEWFHRLCRRIDPCVVIDFSRDTIRLISPPEVGRGRDCSIIHQCGYSRKGSPAHVYGLEIRKGLGGRFSHCVIGIPMNETFIKTVTLPGHISLNNLDKLRQWACSHIPLDEARITVSVDVNEIGANHSKVASIVAVKRETLDWFLSVANSAALSVERVTLRQCGLVEGMRRRVSSVRSGLHVVIDTHEPSPCAHIFFDGKWLSSLVVTSKSKSGEFDLSEIRDHARKWGVSLDEPLTTIQIEQSSVAMRPLPPDREEGPGAFYCGSNGHDLYGLGLLALEESLR